jgi:hypothetical protein
MTFLRLSYRAAILLLAAAAFVGLTAAYAASARYRVPGPQEQTARRSRPPRPQAGELPSIAGEGVLLGFYAVMGRLVWRRLPRNSRSNEEMILLGLRPRRRDSDNATASPPSTAP